MRRQSTAFLISAAFSGLIIGWILLSQRPADRLTPQATEMAQGNLNLDDARPPRPMDEARADALRTAVARDPEDTGARVELGNLYFDAERFVEAIVWFEQALELNPDDVDVSTDLGVSYYYTNQPERALEQLERALALDPKHPKTILNIGIVRAFGKQDLDGAEAAWQQVIEIAPDSPEARTAQEALDVIRAAHPGRGGTALSPPPDGGS